MKEALPENASLVPASLSFFRRSVLEGVVARAASGRGMYKIGNDAKLTQKPVWRAPRAEWASDETLQPFPLRVLGSNRCKSYTPGKPTHATGSSAPSDRGAATLNEEVPAVQPIEQPRTFARCAS